MSETTCRHRIECKANSRGRKKSSEEEEVIRLLRQTEEERLQEIAKKETRFLRIEKMKKEGTYTTAPSWLK
jgi:hypothetical protein